MVQMRTYLELRAQKISTSYDWGGVSYPTLLFKSAEQVPSDVGTTDIQEGVPDTEIEREVINVLFLFPFTIDYVSILDGTISGNVSVSCYGDSYESYYKVEVREIYIDIVKIDTDGTETSLIGGDHLVTSSGPSAGNNTTSTAGYLFWINVSDAKIRASDRLGMRVRIRAWAKVETDPSGNWVRLNLEKNGDDLMVKLPMV